MPLRYQCGFQQVELCFVKEREEWRSGWLTLEVQVDSCMLLIDYFVVWLVMVSRCV